MIELLQAIQILNALLSVGVTALPIAQKVGQVIQKAQEEGRDISQEEWDTILDEADQADIKLAMAINEVSDEPDGPAI